MAKQGLIYDPTAYGRMDDFLTSQGEEFDKIDKSKSIQEKKIIRYAIIFGISVATILVVKLLIKKRK